MKKQYYLIALLLLLLTVGCGSPETASRDDFYPQYQKLKAEQAALQREYDVLLLNYESQKKARAASDNLTASYNELLNKHRNVKIELEILKAQYYAQNAYYEDIFAGLSSGMVKDTSALEELSEQYHEVAERHKIIIGQLAAVNARKATVISDNLTASELKVFYQGWDVWWDYLNRE